MKFFEKRLFSDELEEYDDLLSERFREYADYIEANSKKLPHAVRTLAKLSLHDARFSHLYFDREKGTLSITGIGYDLYFESHFRFKMIFFGVEGISESDFGAFSRVPTPWVMRTEVELLEGGRFCFRALCMQKQDYLELHINFAHLALALFHPPEEISVHSIKKTRLRS